MPTLLDTNAPAWLIDTGDLPAALHVPEASLPRDHSSPSRNLAVLILARDEAGVLAESLLSVRSELQPGDELHVVADHCTDHTASVAAQTGAQVHIRAGQGAAGKGRALAWWVAQTRADPLRPSRVVVLDADSRIAPGFLGGLRRAWALPDAAYQARIVPTTSSSSPVGRLAGFSETAEQEIHDRMCGRFGWSVRLRGTGMGLPRAVLDTLAPKLHTTVEDVELSLLMAERRIPIRSAPEAILFDPKPDDMNAAARQRARWFRGQWQVTRDYRRLILWLLVRYPQSWAMLGSLFLKPKSIWIPLKALVALGAFLAAMHQQLAYIPAIALAASIGWDIACLGFGVLRAQDKSAAIGALMSSPLYLLVWAKSASLALASGDAWLRARPSGELGQPAGGRATGA